jgi:energy-coupling factor transporter ATP-binding protein EcfA2
MSSITAIWTTDRTKARANSYEQICITCGNPVPVMKGQLVSLSSSDGTALRNGALHSYCELSNGYRFREIVSDDFAKGIPDPIEPAKPEPLREPTEDELAKAVSDIMAGTTAAFLEAVPGLVRATLMDLTRTVEIKLPKTPAVKISNSHKILPDVVMSVVAGTSPFLVGPAGSGKTTLAMQIAETLKRKFYAENRVTSEYKLLGYMDATGKYVRTQFREAYEKGGVFLLDEVDASDPDVLTTFNSALANNMCPFPDKLISAHKDFVALAAGNTFGRGADRQYVGRNQLDAATLDRFVVIEVDYDEIAELAWASNDDWTLYVQQVRKAVSDEKVRHIVSPRASIYGARLLAAGMERELVAERCIWKGLDATNRARVIGRLA